MRIAFALPLLSLCTLPSCYAICHDYNGAREITPGTKLSRPSSDLGKVHDWNKATVLFWGLLPLNTASGAELAEAAAESEFGKGFDGVTEVKINEEAEFVDVVVSVLTFGIFAMLTVEVDGTVQGRTGETNR